MLYYYRVIVIRRNQQKSEKSSQMIGNFMIMRTRHDLCNIFQQI